MALRDRIERDVMGIFYRESEFARRHDWNGREIICIMDDVQALMHGSLNAIGVEWDAGSIDMVLRIPVGQLTRAPREAETVYLDGCMKIIRRVAENEGEYIVLLRDSEARGVY